MAISIPCLRIKLRATVRSVEMIEDIRQETLLRVMRHLRAGKPLKQPERLGAFVHGVLKNVTLEMQRFHVRHDQLPENGTEPVDSRVLQEEEFALSERNQMVREVLSELSVKDRAVLALIYLEGVERKEACGRMQISTEHLRVVLYRARVQLRRVIERKTKHRAAL